MFSYDANKVYGEWKIGKTDIYQNVGFSAAHIVYIIQALLDRFDIDRSDFVYSARSNKTAEREQALADADATLTEHAEDYKKMSE